MMWQAREASAHQQPYEGARLTPDDAVLISACAAAVACVTVTRGDI